MSTYPTMPLSVEPQWKRNRRLELARREIEPDAHELTTAALLQSPVNALFNAVDRSSVWFEPEQGFGLHPDDDLFKSLTDGVDPAYWPQFADAVSTQHAFYIRNLAVNKQTYREQLGAAGASGIAAATAAAIIDPVYLAAGLSSFGVGMATGVTRLGQLTRMGIVGGAAFGSIEQFRRTQDPAITPAEVGIAAFGGALGTVAGAATMGMNRGVRFLAGGAAQAAPTAAYDTFTDADRNDIMLNVIPQFFLGGVLGSIGPRDHSMRVDAAARKAMKATEADILKQRAASMGKVWTELLTEKGRLYFSDELQDASQQFFSGLHSKLRQTLVDTAPAGPGAIEGVAATDQGIIAGDVPTEFDPTGGLGKALERAESLDPNKKLGRAEVDAVLEGTGIKAGNQGWPTAHELSGQIEQMIERRQLTASDVYRLNDQAEAESGIFESVGQDMVTEAPSVAEPAAKGSGDAAKPAKPAAAPKVPKAPKAPAEPPAPKPTPVERRLPRTQVFKAMQEEVPDFILEPGNAGKRTRTSVPDALKSIAFSDADSEHGAAPVTDKTRLLSLVGWMDKTGRLKGHDIARLDGAQLRPGDTWAIDGRWEMQVVSTADDAITIRAIDHDSGIPIGDGEMTGGTELEYTVPRDAVIPANKDTLYRADDPVASDAPTAAVGAAAAADPDVQSQMKPVEKIPTGNPRQLIFDHVTDEGASFMRWDAAGMASRAEIPEARRVSNMIGIDHVPKQDGYTYYTAADAAEQFHQANMAEIFPAAKSAYEGFVTEERAAGREPISELDFRKAATDAYETGLPSGNRHIDALVAAVRAVRKRDWETMQANLVPGTIGVDFDPAVIDRYTDRVLLDEVVGTHGREAMIDDVIIRLRRHPGNADIAGDPQKLRAVAISWLDNAASASERSSAFVAHTFENDSVAAYAAQLRKAVPELTDQQINDIVFKTGPQKGDGQVAPKLRRQTRMDTAWVNPNLRHPSSGKAFKMNDILLRDILEIERMNSRYVNGRSAMQEVYRQLSTAGKNIESLPQLLQVLKDAAEARGINPKVIENDLRRIEFMARVVMGIPTHQTTTFTRVGRMIRNLSFARVINTATGIRNFTELGATIADQGFTATTKQFVPALGELFEKIRTGKVDNQATIDMHQMGIAVGDLSHKMLPVGAESDYAPTRGSFEHRLDKKLRVADRGLQKLANLTSTLSLVGPGQVALERVSYRLVSQRWLDMALDGKMTVSEARLKAMTLDPAMGQRILDQIKLPGAVAYDKTGAGNIWAGWNFDAWTDKEAAVAFRRAIYKLNKRQVYKPTPAELAMWMSGDLPKIFTQLRTFMFGSWQSKTLFNLKMHDRSAIVSMVAQLISKAAAYYGITYLYSLGQPDREKYLRDRLEPSRVIRAAISGAEFTSLFPMGVDAIQAIRGEAPLFAFARTTGLGDQPGIVGLVTSNPTADTIDKVARALGVPADKAMDFFEYQAGLRTTFDPRITQKDLKNIKSGLPWQRMLGIDQTMRHLTNQLPKARK